MLNDKIDKFVLMLNASGTIDLKLVEAVGTVLILGHLSSVIGYALVDVLRGKAYPSCKLKMIWVADCRLCIHVRIW